MAPVPIETNAEYTDFIFSMRVSFKISIRDRGHVAAQNF